jgi:Transferrin receptor-like dimerisation domain
MRLLAIKGILLGLIFGLVSTGAQDALLQGFTRANSATERDWETKFRALPSPDNEREYMRRLSARPHHVGSSYDKENAEWILSSSDGLLRRPWYKHMLYAPGVYSGYGVKTLPGIREAIEEKHWAEPDSEIARAAAVLDHESALINSAAAELEQGFALGVSVARRKSETHLHSPFACPGRDHLKCPIPELPFSIGRRRRRNATSP